jgi:hypothetical protein
VKALGGKVGIQFVKMTNKELALEICTSHAMFKLIYQWMLSQGCFFKHANTKVLG